MAACERVPTVHRGAVVGRGSVSLGEWQRAGGEGCSVRLAVLAHPVQPISCLLKNAPSSSTSSGLVPGANPNRPHSSMFPLPASSKLPQQVNWTYFLHFAETDTQHLQLFDTNNVLLLTTTALDGYLELRIATSHFLKSYSLHITSHQTDCVKNTN